MPGSYQTLPKRVVLFNKQHSDMSTCKNNRIDSVSNKNIDCGFGNSDWQGTSYSRVGLCPAIDMPLLHVATSFSYIIKHLVSILYHKSQCVTDNGRSNRFEASFLDWG